MCLDFRCMAGLSDSYPSQGIVSHLSQHQAAGVLGEEPNLRENKPRSNRGTCVHTEPCVTSAGVRAAEERASGPEAAMSKERVAALARKAATDNRKATRARNSLLDYNPHGKLEGKFHKDRDASVRQQSSSVRLNLFRSAGGNGRPHLTSNRRQLGSRRPHQFAARPMR